MEDKRTISQLARDALEIQYGTNLTGLVHGFSRAMRRLRELVPNEATEFFRQHPLALLLIDKLRELSRYTGGKVMVAYSWAEQQKNEVEEVSI